LRTFAEVNVLIYDEEEEEDGGHQDLSLSETGTKLHQDKLPQDTEAEVLGGDRIMTREDRPLTRADRLQS
jgi:hypothetical protein